MKYEWRDIIHSFAVTVLSELVVFAAIGYFIFFISVWSIIAIGN